MAPFAGTTYGFIGNGEVSARAAKAILKDQFEAQENGARFVVPVTADHWSDSIDAAVSFAEANDIEYEVVTDDTTADLKDLADVVKNAEKVHEATDVVAVLISVLEKANNPVLVVAWSDEDPNCTAAFAAADALEIAGYDLCDGFDKIEFEDPNAEPAAATTEPPASEPDVAYTEDQLEAMDFDEVRDIYVEKMGKEPLPPRSRKSSYITAILTNADPDTGEVAPSAPTGGGDDEVEIPNGDRDAVRVPDERDETTQNTVNVGAYSQLVGNCHGCGGPVFAKGEPPVMTWDHAEYCPIGTEQGFSK
jgi:hypothetical protein